MSQHLSGGASVDLAARLRESEVALEQGLNQIEVVCDLIRSANGPLTPDAVAAEIVTWVAKWLPADGWAVVGTSGPGECRVLSAQSLWPDAEATAVTVGSDVMEQSRPYLVARLSDVWASLGSGAAIAFPLVSRGHAVGALVGFARRPSLVAPALSEAVLGALLEVLQAPAVALENAQRVERAEALSVTDELTSLYNLRYLRQALRREDKRRKRSRQPLSCVFADLDDFKKVNDQNGHVVGSRLLVEVAKIIRDCSRETDVAARFGGDEFALVLPDTDLVGAMAVAARCRRTVGSTTFLRDEGLAVRLTISIGVATTPDTTARADALIEAADAAMYKVKTHGKDGIELASGEATEGVPA